ncbi:hypothetical protein JJP89_03350 [Enterobacter hormaechei]|nr:hypothetical protein [Enterobacter hormaechei]MBE7910453.1 hypothetical protein [Enterobacter cloacae complex sp. S2]HBM2588041.1 hypothetical protein [Enterobacter hormaechei subsp. hoffmannii]EKX8280700.1 hypothetical protein [Enterobacter hormaechei]EKZ1674152.1 hypothetical protein [Enterobacter hormaechei]
MQTPLQDPPHIAQDPVPVIAVVSGFVGEVRLVTLYLGVSIRSGEVPIENPQLLNEDICAQIAITLGIELYGRNEGGVYICCAWHNYLTK